MLARIALLLTAALCLGVTTAHNWLTKPMAFNTRFPTRDCRGAECTNACPPIMLPHEMANTVNRPAAVWKRGQNVQVSWARNNHHGGLFRLSLVPVPSMNDRAMHTKFTIMHGCFESGIYNCRRAHHPCGTDNSHAYRRRFTIPQNMPDGDYVLGYVWYGGLHFSRKKGQFPDFFSCSFVRIAGGGYARGWYAPQWAPGHGRHIHNGLCFTASTSVGTCGRRGCGDRKAFWAKSRAFANGHPPKFNAQDVRNAFSVKASDLSVTQGLCKTGVCCPKTCGQCGGSACHKLRGGADNCCIATIKRAGKPCKTNAPPCVIDP